MTANRASVTKNTILQSKMYCFISQYFYDTDDILLYHMFDTKEFI